MLENLKLIGAAIALLLIVALIPISIWARVAAPCKYVDWLPTNEVPSRCLSVRVLW
jgi:hypothetical protein